MTEWHHPKSIHFDLRGSHQKIFGLTPDKIHIPNFEIKEVFITDNKKNTLRGMHFQVDPEQPKLLTCVAGKALVNVLSLDRNSKNFLKTRSFTVRPSSDFFIHVQGKHALGYLSLEDDTRMLYLAGSDFSKDGDMGIDPFDAGLCLPWGIEKDDAILSDRDLSLPSLSDYLKNHKGENVK